MSGEVGDARKRLNVTAQGRCGMCGNAVDTLLRTEVESLLADLTEYANDKKHPARREVAASLICLRLRAALGDPQ